MSKPIAFTLDLEDHRPDNTAEIRYVSVVESLLDKLDAWGTTATVFVVGDLIDESPELISQIAERGHEIGLHGARHTPLPEVGPQKFQEETARFTKRLEELIGAPVRGFRAPIFSLVAESAWAPEILTDLGFSYSSSVLPAANPLFGWPDTPRTPFRWPCGLVELPAPVFGVGRLSLPVLGGTYLRCAPSPAVGLAQRLAAKHPAPWVYAHPYDFDPGELRWLVPEAGRLGSRLLWYGRHHMSRRVQRLSAGSATTLAKLAQLHAEVEVFDPSSLTRSPTPTPTPTPTNGEYRQSDLVHKLPRAKLVDRVDWLVERCRDRRVIHVGFGDAGFREEQDRAGRWLHTRLAEVASELVGIDSDTSSVERAVAEGFEAYTADCTDGSAIEALKLQPAEIVVAGEIVEHVDSPGPFLKGLLRLCDDDGRLLVTTPNAAGLVTVAASLSRGVEVNHPDHIVMFTWRTLTELLKRSGWSPVRSAVYVPSVRERGDRSRLDWLGVRCVLGTERLLARVGRPFAADGLIVEATPTANAQATTDS